MDRSFRNTRADDDAHGWVSINRASRREEMKAHLPPPCRSAATDFDEPGSSAAEPPPAPGARDPAPNWARCMATGAVPFVSLLIPQEGRTHMQDSASRTGLCVRCQWLFARPSCCSSSSSWDGTHTYTHHIDYVALLFSFRVVGLPAVQAHQKKKKRKNYPSGS